MSKLSRLRDNIEALEHAFTSTSPYNTEILHKYTGFGGLGFVLNPLDPTQWKKSDLDCYADTYRLHELLHEESADEQEYNRWVQSLKASTLTAFYTPKKVVKAIDQALLLVEADTDGKYFLDPAAGSGTFLKLGCLAKKSVAYEKDLLTGLLLSRNMYGKHKNVEVRVNGFETIPAGELGKYDMVATNVPFGDIRVFDADYTNSKSEVRRDAAKMIHRYYVLKGLDCLRDGGIEAYIITSNYLNRDSLQLAEALRQARLVGAYRLANNLFKEAGTEVGTDLLVLQKDTKKQALTADESLLLSTYESEGCPANMYFDCYPDHVIATSKVVDTDAYGKPGFIYTHEKGEQGIAKDLQEVLKKDLEQNLDKKLYDANANGNGNANGNAKQASHTPQEKELMAMHDCYTTLYDNEARNMTEDTENRKKLNRLYDEWVAKYGYLNKGDNAKAAKKIGLAELLALEIRDEKGCWQKADIMQKPVAFSTDELHEAHTPQDALAQSLNDYGKPDMQYMAAMTGMTEDDLLTALDGEVYLNPLTMEYEIKAKFVSGNVIEKLEAVRKKYPKVAQVLDGVKDADGNLPVLVVPEEMRILHAMRALQDAVPTPIPFDELDFNLGERWIDPRLYAAFGGDFFSMSETEENSYWSGKVEMKVQYNALLDQFAVSVSRRNEKIYSQYSVSSEATKRLDGVDLFIHALHNTCPKMQKYQRDSEGRCIYNDKGEHMKEEDPEKTQLANAKVEEIRQGWQDWLMKQSKELRDDLTEKYNRRFNCFVKPKYDGSHQKFPGLSRENLAKEIKSFKDLYQSQKDCIWMLIQNGGGICDHEVGGGKTLIMCIAAYEMKRLGLVHKPMIIGLKANVDEIAKTYRMCYPEAKVLYAGAKDYAAKERVNFFNKMKNNDWDVVIMSHDQFGRIPQSEEIQLEVMQEELDKLEASLNDLQHSSDWSISSQMRKGLERRKRNMEAKIFALQASIRKNADDVVDFKMMGVDHIFVDESHQFKNLGFTTRHDRVAGLGNAEGSKRAYNLLMAIRTIQKRTGRDLGATFLSGTTVTNSLTELYSLFNYLRPKALQRQGITCFDAWAAIFTKKSTEFEFSITNQIILKERFRMFIKVPELAMMYNEITDFRTAEDVGLDRPERHCMLLHIKPTPDQEEFIKTLMEFAKTGNFSLIGKADATDKQQKAKMLYATDMARKMSLDMRLIDEGYEDHPRSKASQCAKLVKKYYDQYNEQKGTQMIFSDLSAYDPKKWNIYSEIKRKLVEEYGIPQEEIRFIQECKCESKKQALIKDVNEGKVRVLFGSTSMLGTGVNAQQRVVAVHHLDTPWRPSDLEQRDGRAIRKGNEVAKLYADNKVDIIIYAVERSLDSYKFYLLDSKQKFIQQLKRGRVGQRTLDEGAMDEHNGMSFAEYMAVLSGNRDLLDRAKLDKQIAGLESERKMYQREKVQQEEKQANLRKENEALTANIQTAQKDAQRFEQAAQTTADGTVVNTITVNGIATEAPVGSEDYNKAMGQALLKIAATARTNGSHMTVGEVYGFPVSVKTKTWIDNFTKETEHDNMFYVSGERLIYIVNKTGHLNKTSATLSAALPLATLQRIKEMAAGWQQIHDENEASISQLEKIIRTPWGKEAELKKLRAELAMLDRRINETLKKEEQGQQDSAASDGGDVRKAA